MTSSWYIIINPRAGSGKTMQEWLPAEEKLKKYRIPYVEALTQHRQHAVELAYKAAAEGYRRILSVGGDGTLHEIFQGIMKWCDESGTAPEEFYMGVAPIGSGNDWIKSLYIEKDTCGVIKLIEQESFGTMDVIRVESSGFGVCYMANVGGVGFDAQVCDRANRLKSHGWRNKLLYLRSLRYCILNARTLKLKVVADGKTCFEGDCYSVALGNGRYSGGGMRQVPEARLNDGVLDAMIVPKMPVKSMFSELPKLLNGTIMTSPWPTFCRCCCLEILPAEEDAVFGAGGGVLGGGGILGGGGVFGGGAAGRSDIIEVDGEIKGTLPAKFTVTGQKINVIKGLNRII